MDGRGDADQRPCTDRAPANAISPLERFGAATGLAAIVAVGIASVAERADNAWGPGWLWWLVYAVYLGVFLVDAFVAFERTPRTDHVLVALLLVPGCMLFTLQPQGWSGVVLVVTVASAAFAVGPRALAAIVVGQIVLIATAMAATAWWDPAEVVLGTIIYGSFMTFAALVVRGQQREAEARAELAGAHDRLAAAHTGLSSAHAELSRTNAELSRTNAELRATSALLASATRSSERLRISRDLHDVVGHQLTALALELEVASHATGPDDEHVLRARQIAKDLLRDVRSAVGELRVTSRELEPALRELVRDLPGLAVDLHVDEQVPVSETEALTLVRSVQEVVTNTLRHAEATRLTIRVVSDETGVRLHAQDDGRGAASLRPGNGLTGLRERVEERGGRVVFEPGGDGSGFTVDALLPTP